MFERPGRGAPGVRFESVETLDGYCLLMPRSVFDRIGGFDERLDGWHFYDVDVCMRAIAAGYVNYVLDQPTTHVSWGRSDAEWERLRAVWLDTWEETWFRSRAGLRAAVYSVAAPGCDRPGLPAPDPGDEPADVYLLDAGGGTAGRFRDVGAEVASRRLSPWRADIAWNAALALVPAEVDVCLPLHVGETLAKGWRDAIEEAWTVRATRMEHRVLEHVHGAAPWSVKEARPHAREGYHWVGAAVARLAPVSGLAEHVVESADVLLERRRGAAEQPGLALLELAAAERPHDPAPLLDLARALADAGRWWECAARCRVALDLAAGLQPVERATACILLGRCFEELVQPAEAERWLVRAVSEAPGQREPRIALAELHQRRDDHAAAYAAAKASLRLRMPSEHPLQDPASWRERAHDLVAVSAFYLGFGQESLAEALAAVEENPWDQRLIDNHNLIQELTAGAPSAQAATVDAIVLSNAASATEYALTRTTIQSLRLSSPGIGTKVVVVETNAGIHDEPFAEQPPFAPEVDVVLPGGAFAINRALRAGYEALSGSRAPHLLLLNNDVVLFGEGFLEELVSALDHVDSASPLGLREATWSGIDRTAGIVHGYDVNTVLHGWCVLVRRSVVEAVGFEALFPPEFTFYGQDVHYGETLREHGLAHGLVTSAKALHLGGSSHHLLPVPPEQTLPASRHAPSAGDGRP
jgi:GT2 family glycosyltransferase